MTYFVRWKLKRVNQPSLCRNLTASEDRVARPEVLAYERPAFTVPCRIALAQVGRLDRGIRVGLDGARNSRAFAVARQSVIATIALLVIDGISTFVFVWVGAVLSGIVALIVFLTFEQKPEQWNRAYGVKTPFWRGALIAFLSGIVVNLANIAMEHVVAERLHWPV